MDQSSLTSSGEQFLSDLLQEYRDGGDDHFMSDVCEDWGLEYVVSGNVRIPHEHENYGAIITSNAPPLLLKTQFGLLNPIDIRHHPRDTYPYFHNEVFGEICLWEEALRRGKPHTDLFAPIFRYDTSNYEWAVVAFATDIQHRGRPASKRVEKRGRELGWAPDDTEVGLFEGRYVAVDYGLWWRRNDEWKTAVDEFHYRDIDSIYDRVETQIPDDAPTPSTPPTSTDDQDATHGSSDTAVPTAQQTNTSDSRRVRLQRWVSSLFS